MSMKGTLHKKFDIRKIERDELLQARVNLDHTVVKAYAGEMKNGDQFPPLVLFQDGEGATVRYWLADGWHRLAAYEQNQHTKVPVSVYHGTYRDALLYALGANAQHGLRRSRADKQKAVDTALLDTEWQQWSNEEIAKRVHVDAKTVGNRRKILEKAGKIPIITIRKSTRNGKTTTTSTGKIGRKRQPVEAGTPSPQDSGKEHDDATQERPHSDEPVIRNEEKIFFDNVENPHSTDDMSEAQSRRECIQAMGASEELFTQIQEAIATYKMEHPLLPDAYVQQAISTLWSAWSGFGGFPMMSGLCQCQTSRAGRASLPPCQREYHVPL